MRKRESEVCCLELCVKRPRYFDLPIKKRLPITAVICACLFIFPPFIVGFIGHWPEHYYKDDDPSKGPIVRWRSHANLFYNNWINYFVYQLTPYDIEQVHQ